MAGSHILLHCFLLRRAANHARVDLALRWRHRKGWSQIAPPLIVAIDDEPSILGVYIEFLEEEGYRVVGCDAKADAVSCVQREHPDAVLFDLCPLTLAQDWAAYQALAEDPTTARIPVILCTTTAPAEFRQPVEVRGLPVAILHKPFQIEDLLGSVKTALGS